MVLGGITAMGVGVNSFAEPGEPNTDVLSCQHNTAHFAYVRVPNTCVFKHNELIQSENDGTCEGEYCTVSGEHDGEDCIITEVPVD